MCSKHILVTLCLPSANTNLSLPKLIILRNAFCLILTDIFHIGKKSQINVANLSHPYVALRTHFV